MRIHEIRRVLESNGLMLHEWERARTDRVRIQETELQPVSAAV
jgi:hypothetical protein